MSATPRAVVLRYHPCWKHRDLDGVVALYHPEVYYHDFFQNRLFCLAQLRESVGDALTLPANCTGDGNGAQNLRADALTRYCA